MGRMGDNWATQHRNWRAIFVAIGLSFVLIWSLALKHQDDARLFIETQKVIATVKDISTTEIDSRYGGKSMTYFVTLDLPEGKVIRFMLFRPPPKVGSQVPVSIDIYDDGSQYHHYDEIDWQLL